MKIEIGKTYKDKSGRYIKIHDGFPPIDGKRIGWNGIYWGSSVDDKLPKMESERYTFEGKWWSYLSQYSSFGYRELSDPKKDLIEEII